jgi:hypothetical protein
MYTKTTIHINNTIGLIALSRHVYGALSPAAEDTRPPVSPALYEPHGLADLYCLSR